MWGQRSHVRKVRRGDGDRLIREEHAAIGAALGVTLYEHYTPDGVLSAQWVRVNPEELAGVALRLIKAEQELAEACADLAGRRSYVVGPRSNHLGPHDWVDGRCGICGQAVTS